MLTSVHVAHGALLVGGGVAFALLAATTPGPTAIVRVVPVRLHAVLDVGVALCLALAPVLPSLRPDLTGILVVEFAAVGWLRVTTLTSFSGRRRARAGPAGGGAQHALEAGAGAQHALEAGARRLGRHTGRVRRAWQRQR
ncbi:MAG TPA: hypothetical protein VEI83_15430 [Acidimicrobiales bacterium]|nr:hypothetical protein [Acidimicrobiales bacterium]